MTLGVHTVNNLEEETVKSYSSRGYFIDLK